MTQGSSELKRGVAVCVFSSLLVISLRGRTLISHGTSELSSPLWYVSFFLKISSCCNWKGLPVKRQANPSHHQT